VDRNEWAISVADGIYPPRTCEISGISGKAMRRRIVLAPVSLAVFSLALLVLCMDRSVSLYDEAIILEGAERLLAGALPHRDFYAIYGPAQFAAVAAIFKLVGPSIAAARIWDLVIRAATVPIVFMLAHRASWSMAWFAAVLSAVWLATTGFYLFPLFPALTLSLASALLLAPTLEGERAPVRLVAGGFLAALTGAFRYDVGVATLGIESITLAVIALWGAGLTRPGLRRLIDIALPFAIGAVLVIGPLAIWFVAAGMVDGLVLDVITLTARNYAAVRNLPFPNLSNWRSLGVYQPVVALVACLPVFCLLAWRRQNVALPMMLAALTVMFFGKGWVRASIIHMSAAIIASLALLALVLPRARSLGRLAAAPVVAGAGFAVVCAVANIGPAISSAKANLSWLASGMHCRLAVGPAACLLLSPEEVDASRLVQHLTKPNEPIFVGLGRHDRILMNDIALYVLSERPPATKWYQMDPGVQTTEPIQRDIVEELRDHCVRVLVRDTRWDNVTEPNASAVSSGVTLLDDAIRHDYAQVENFGPISVLEVRPGLERPGCPAAARTTP